MAQYKAAKQNVFSNLCDEIHSVDRIKIVKQIKELEKKFGIVKTYYIQVNTGNELQKSGVKMNEVDEFIRIVKVQV